MYLIKSPYNAFLKRRPIQFEIQVISNPAGHFYLSYLNRCHGEEAHPFMGPLLVEYFWGIDGSSNGDHQSWTFRFFKPSTSLGGRAMAGISYSHPLLMSSLLSGPQGACGVMAESLLFASCLHVSATSASCPSIGGGCGDRVRSQTFVTANTTLGNC